MSLIYGLVTGIVFGILLQRAEVLRYDRQVGALRLRDMTILKFMLSAIVMAAFGIYLLKDLGLVSLSLKATSLGAQIVGGHRVRDRVGASGLLPGHGRRGPWRGTPGCRLGAGGHGGRGGALRGVLSRDESHHHSPGAAG